MRRIIIIVTTLCLGLSSIGLASTANANQEEGSNGTTYDGTNGTISCSLFGSVTVTNNILSNGMQCFGTLEVPMGVTTIGAGAFSGAELTSITLPTSVTTIGTNAFAAATSLTSITLPTGVTSIGAGAFDRATSLTSITFAQGSQLTSIGIKAFNGATSLTSITIPKSVTTIGANAFAGATSLISIIVDSPLKAIHHPFVSTIRIKANPHIKNGCPWRNAANSRFGHRVSRNNARSSRSMVIVTRDGMCCIKSCDYFAGNPGISHVNSIIEKCDSNSRSGNSQ
jgi:hypothetical protein